MRGNLKSGAALAGALMLSVAAVGPASVAAANSTTASMPVAATVVAVCAVVAAPLVYGNYNSSTATSTDAETSITVNCTPGAVYQVGLSAGQNSSDVNDRKMKLGGGTDLLGYLIFRDAGYTQNWGNTSGIDTVSGVGLGQDQILTVFGRLPAGAPVSVGAYSDVVTVTVTF